MEPWTGPAAGLLLMRPRLQLSQSWTAGATRTEAPFVWTTTFPPRGPPEASGKRR